MNDQKRLSVLVLVLFLNACGGGGGTPPPPPPPPAITLTLLAPDHVPAGSGDQNLFVDGTGFTTSSVVLWNGIPVPTSFGTSQILTTTVPALLLAQPGSAQVTVKDGATTSNALAFGIASPASLTAGVVAMITLATDGTPGDGDSLVGPAISATGRYVAFQSNAPNLAPGPQSGFQEIYERDTCIGAPSGCVPATIRITSTFDGSAVNGHSRNSAISADGRYVAFDTSATNIAANSTICGSAPVGKGACVFVRDTCTGASASCTPTTTTVIVATDGTISGGSLPSFSGDGRYIAFYSASSDIVSGDNNGVGDMFLRDTCHGAPVGCLPETTLIPLSTSGTQANNQSFASAVSSNGRYVAFRSYADNLVPNDSNGQDDYFLRDTCLGVPSTCTPSTIRVDVSNSGAQTNGTGFDFSPSVSGNGRLVGFSTNATNLISQDVHGWGQSYVRDTCTGVSSGCTPRTSLVSVGNDGAIPNSPSDSEVMTPDGRFFAFSSLASNLVPGDTFPAGGFRDVFVRDTCFGATNCTPSTVRVSVTNSPNPETQSDGPSSQPAISADGHYVVFISPATWLVPGLTGNGHSMVYIAKTGF